MPLFEKALSPLTSGTTRGISGSFRKALLLSITIAPYFLKIGANSREILAPAEKSAKSICFFEIFFSQSSSTTIFLSLK